MGDYFSCEEKHILKRMPNKKDILLFWFHEYGNCYKFRSSKV